MLYPNLTQHYSRGADEVSHWCLERERERERERETEQYQSQEGLDWINLSFKCFFLYGAPRRDRKPHSKSLIFEKIQYVIAHLICLFTNTVSHDFKDFAFVTLAGC